MKTSKDIEILKNIDERDQEGNTKLHLACKEGTLKDVYDLIELGYDLNATNKYGITPLVIAYTHNSHPEVLRYLVEKTNFSEKNEQSYNQYDLVTFHNMLGALNKKGVCTGLCDMYAVDYHHEREKKQNKQPKTPFLKKLFLEHLKGKYTLSSTEEYGLIPGLIYIPIPYSKGNDLTFKVYDKNGTLQEKTIPYEQMSQGLISSLVNNGTNVGQQDLDEIKSLIQQQDVALESESNINLRVGMYQHLMDIIHEDKKYENKYAIDVGNGSFYNREMYNSSERKPSETFKENIKLALEKTGNAHVVGFVFTSRSGQPGHITAIKPMVIDDLQYYQFFDPNSGKTKPLTFDELVNELHKAMPFTLKPVYYPERYQDFLIIDNEDDIKEENKLYFKISGNNELSYYLKKNTDELISGTLNIENPNVNINNREELSQFIQLNLGAILKIAEKRKHINNLFSFDYKLIDLSQKVIDLKLVSGFTEIKDQDINNSTSSKKRMKYFIETQNVVEKKPGAMSKEMLEKYYTLSGRPDLVSSSAMLAFIHKTIWCYYEVARGQKVMQSPYIQTIMEQFYKPDEYGDKGDISKSWQDDSIFLEQLKKIEIDDNEEKIIKEFYDLIHSDKSIIKENFVAYFEDKLLREIYKTKIGIISNYIDVLVSHLEKESHSKTIIKIKNILANEDLSDNKKMKKISNKIDSFKPQKENASYVLSEGLYNVRAFIERQLHCKELCEENLTQAANILDNIRLHLDKINNPNNLEEQLKEYLERDDPFFSKKEDIENTLKELNLSLDDFTASKQFIP